MENIMMPNTIIFDLDNTLVDTERIKAVLVQAAEEAGLSHESAVDLYRSSTTSDGVATFTLEHFSDCLDSALRSQGIELDDLHAERLHKKVKDGVVLRDGARELLDDFRQQNAHMVLISFGKGEWQREKIERAGLREYFDEREDLFPEEEKGGKIDAMKRSFGNDHSGNGLVLFNDKPDETARILEAFPELVVFVPRHEQDIRYTEKMFSDLAERFAGRVFWGNSVSQVHEAFVERFPKEIGEGRKELAYGR
jgi:phosphoglycolate phosphatase-like HAD superfamily hydrolase